jgi:AcrR family transcriptional regulator
MTSLSKGETTAERILHAAFKSIAARCCSTVTQREIAQGAKVALIALIALSQLNYHYGNRDRLFTAVLKRMKQDYVAALDERLDGSRTLVERVTILVDHNRHMLQESPNTCRAFLDFFNFGTSADAFRQEVAGFLDDIANLIETRIGQSGDTGKNTVSAAVVTRFILSASFGISLQHLLNPNNTEVLAGFDLLKAGAAGCAS